MTKFKDLWEIEVGDRVLIDEGSYKVPHIITDTSYVQKPDPFLIGEVDGELYEIRGNVHGDTLFEIRGNVHDNTLLNTFN